MLAAVDRYALEPSLQHVSLRTCAFAALDLEYPTTSGERELTASNGRPEMLLGRPQVIMQMDLASGAGVCNYYLSWSVRVIP